MMKNIMLSLIFTLGMTLPSSSQGTTYCTSNPNSSGNTASISFCINDGGPPPPNPWCAVMLNAPAGVYTQLLCGTSPMSNPFGNGMFCMNPMHPIYRVGPMVITAPNGSAVQWINWGVLPNPMMQPLYFQWIFRDPTATGFSYNTSNAMVY
jgi:hypothetical protein